MRPLFSALLLSIACAGTPAAQSRPVAPEATAAATSKANPPRLVVYIVVDQLSQGHLNRWGHLLSGGLGRLLGEDAFRATGVYPHAVTETCPGHATLATGASPAVHGIVGNHFTLDGEPAYCLDATPMPAESIGDAARSGGRQVAAVSIKDRGATLIGGSDPSLVVWFDRKAGQELTGSYQAPVPLTPPLVPQSTWMAWAGSAWELHDPEQMATLDIPDEQAQERDPGVGTTFPHPPGDPATGPAGLAGRLMYTPAGGDYLTAAGLAAVDRLGLGQGAAPDLLGLSYSHFDGVGHAFTPSSLEAVDTLVRLDQQLGDLFAGLDQRVGAGNWTAVLSADHGNPLDTPIYVDLVPLEAGLADALEARGLPPAAEVSVTAITLQDGLTAQQRRASAEAAREAALGIPGVADVLDLENLSGPFATAWRNNLFEGRNADLEVILDEGAIPIFRGIAKGSTHGSPRSYDTEVPVLAWGAGVRKGVSEPVDVRSVAPTVAALLGVPAPRHAEAPALEDALLSATP